MAKRMGARVLAVASGDDGVALAERLGAGRGRGGAEGRRDDGSPASLPLSAGLMPPCSRPVKGWTPHSPPCGDGGRIAFPHGVEPEPKPRAGVTAILDGTPNARDIARMNELITAGPFVVNVARTFSLDEAAERHQRSTTTTWESTPWARPKGNA